MGRAYISPSALTSNFAAKSVLFLLTLSFSLSLAGKNHGSSLEFKSSSSTKSSSSVTSSSSSSVSNSTPGNSVGSLLNISSRSSVTSISGQSSSTSGYSIISLDAPKIKVLQYRVKNVDPHIISEELNCIGTRCDDLVEPESKVRLGSGENEISEWSVPPSVTQIVIECQSKSGLVEWDYDGKGVIPDIDIETSRYAGDFWTKSTYSYITILKINNVTDQLTGRYTCRNVEKYHVSNSFYMFVPQESLHVYEEGETVDITPPVHATEIIIPCRVQNKKTSIYLFKKRGNGSYRRIDLENGVTFDPYIGFRLPATRDVFGSYACKVDIKRRKQRDISLAMTPPPPIEEINTSPSSLSSPSSSNPLDPNSLGGSSSQKPFSAVRPPLGTRLTKRRRKRPFLPLRSPFPPRRGGNLHLHQRRNGPPPRRGVYFHLRRPQVPFAAHGNISPPAGQGVPLMNQQGPHYGPLSSQPVSTDRLSGPVFPFFSHPPLLQKPVKVLPTYSNMGAGGTENPGLVLNPLSSFSSEEKPISQEMGNLKISSVEMSSRLDANVGNNSNGNSYKQKLPPKRGNLFPPNLFPPAVNVVQTMQCMLKKVLLGFDAPCTGNILEMDYAKDKMTILEVNVYPPPENKFFPKNSVVHTTVPFFVKWQTRYTDYADWAEVNHTLPEGTYKRHKAGIFDDGVNSLEIFNLNEGDTGRISVAYMGEQKEILVHTWNYFIINNTVNNAKGLKHVKDGTYHLFKCRSTSSSRPKITLTQLSENGCPLDSDPDHKVLKETVLDYPEEDCGPGCTLLRTKADQGIVNCNGDGVEENLRFPTDLYCTGRPYFVDRGRTKNITFEGKSPILTIPCIINNPNADVYLFRASINGTVEEVTDFTKYDLKTGFELSFKNMKDQLGTYYCTSTTDLNDDTDMITYEVIDAPEYVFHPSTKRIYGTPPFKFMWESKEELKVQNTSMGSFYSGLFPEPEHMRAHVGTFEVSALNVPPGASGEVKVIKVSNGEIVHSWFYKHSKKPGLWLDKEKNVFKCQSTSDMRPKLYAIECSNPNVCKMKKRFATEEEAFGRDTSNCGIGCSQLKVWGNKPTGYVRCSGDGVDASSQYFLAHNSTLLTEKDDLEKFKAPVITNLVRKLRIGETTSFVCRANRFFYSKGFQWAVETRNGSKKFMDLKVREDDSYLNEIKSEINLKISDADWKAVWCFAPLIDSVHWGNVSQPIYIKI